MRPDRQEQAGCPTCKAQIKEHRRFEIKKKQNDEYYIGNDDMPFHMLIMELIAKPKENPKEKMISGCEVFFPDTVFFLGGNKRILVQNDKDYCLSKYNESDEKKQSNQQELINRLNKATIARKAMSSKGRLWLQKAKEARQAQVNKAKQAQNPDRFLEENTAGDEGAAAGESSPTQQEGPGSTLNSSVTKKKGTTAKKLGAKGGGDKQDQLVPQG